jgi:hypothetical protein
VFIILLFVCLSIAIPKIKGRLLPWRVRSEWMCRPKVDRNVCILTLAKQTIKAVCIFVLDRVWGEFGKHKTLITLEE